MSKKFNPDYWSKLGTILPHSPTLLLNLFYITFLSHSIIKKKNKVMIQKKAKGFCDITLQEGMEKSPVLLSQYWINQQLIAQKLFKILGAPI